MQRSHSGRAQACSQPAASLISGVQFPPSAPKSSLLLSTTHFSEHVKKRNKKQIYFIGLPHLLQNL